MLQPFGVTRTVVLYRSTGLQRGPTLQTAMSERSDANVSNFVECCAHFGVIQRTKPPLRARFGCYHACTRSSPAPFRYIPVSSQAGTPEAGVAMSAGGSSWDRFLVWKVFVKKADQKFVAKV